MHIFTINNHRIPLARVCKDHPVCQVFQVAMDITGYQAATVEMEQRAREVWSVPLGHVVRKEPLEKMAEMMTTETGNSVRGKIMMDVKLAFSRYELIWDIKVNIRIIFCYVNNILKDILTAK